MKAILLFLLLLCADIFIIFCSFLLSMIIGDAFYNDWFFDFFPIVALIISLFVCRGLYTRRFDFWNEWRIIVGSCVFACFVCLIFYLAVKEYNFILNYSFFLFFVFLVILLPVFKLMFKYLLFSLGFWKKKVRILGDEKNNKKNIFENYYLGYINALEEEYDTLFINEKEMHLKSIEIAIGQNIKENKEIVFLPTIQEYSFTQAYSCNIFNSRISLITLQNSLQNKFRATLKRVLDIFLIMLILPLFLVVCLIVALVIKIQEPNGRVFFSHKRIGFRGKSFDCLKFRSMKENSDEILKQYLKENPEEALYFRKYHKYRRDPRITKVGNFIRKTSIDELPQLINVLKGDMSIVGPRPYAEYERKDMGEFADIILAVKPGITGIWQVSGRSDVDFATRTKMDAWYMKNWSIWCDIVIIIKTFGVVLSRKGAS